MPLSAEALSWYVFGGLVFIFMGAGLACGAEEKARAAAQWGTPSESGSSEREADPRWVQGYRGFGLVFCVAGFTLLASLRLAPGALSELFPPLDLGAASGLVLGLTLMTLGSFMAVMKVLRAGGFLYRWTRPAEGAPPETMKKRLARLSGWLVVAAFVGQGLILVRLALAG